MTTELELNSALESIILHEDAAIKYNNACRVLLEYIIEKHQEADEIELIEMCGQTILEFKLLQLAKLDLVDLDFSEPDGTIKYDINRSKNPVTIKELLENIEPQ